MPKKSSIHYKYNPAHSIKENAELCGVSVAAFRKYIRDNEIDRKYDAHYVRWKKITDYYKKNTKATLKKASEELGFSINTIRKYKSLSEEKLYVSKVDTEKVSSFNICNKNAIKTISYNQSEILAWIMRLYNNRQPFECDLTFSIGNFYRHIPQPQYKYDKYPQVEGVKPLDEVDLLPDESFHSVVYDLPFIVSSGAMSKIKERFTYFESIDEIYRANDEMLERSHRILKEQGLLIVKTMDVCHGNKQLWISDYVVQKAYDLGFQLIEKFILLSNLRLFARTHQQKVARKYHSYFFVFRKCKKNRKK